MTSHNAIEEQKSAFIRGAIPLAEYLGVHEMTVRRWMRQRRIPFVKLGGAVLFRRAEIEALLERNTVPAVGTRKGRKGVA